MKPHQLEPITQPTVRLAVGCSLLVLLLLYRIAAALPGAVAVQLAIVLGEDGSTFPPVCDVIPVVFELPPAEDAPDALGAVAARCLTGSTDFYFSTLAPGLARVDCVIELYLE